MIGMEYMKLEDDMSQCEDEIPLPFDSTFHVKFELSPLDSYYFVVIVEMLLRLISQRFCFIV